MRKILLCSIALSLAATLAEAQTAVTCASTNGKYHECRVSATGRVVLSRQLSDQNCVEGKNWGTKNGMVWVSGGCRGEFNVTTLPPSGTSLVCESLNNVRHTCRVDARGGVTLARRLSDNACARGKNWDVRDDGTGIWVDNGCRAEFRIGDFGTTQQRAAAHTVLCESQNNGRTHCDADTSYGVMLTSQVSKNDCALGHDWGYDQTGVWVDNGCRATFTIGGYRDGTHLMPMTSAARPTMMCESRDGKRNFCRADTGFGVTLVRQTSDAKCERGMNWGYDQDGIWVDNGCRAEFLLDANR